MGRYGIFGALNMKLVIDYQDGKYNVIDKESKIILNSFESVMESDAFIRGVKYCAKQRLSDLSAGNHFSLINGYNHSYMKIDNHPNLKITNVNQLEMKYLYVGLDDYCIYASNEDMYVQKRN